VARSFHPKTIRFVNLRILAACLLIFLLAPFLFRVMADSISAPPPPHRTADFTVTLIHEPLPEFFPVAINAQTVYLQAIYAHLQWSPDVNANGFDFNVTRWDGTTVKDDLDRMPSYNTGIRATNSYIDLLFYADEAGKVISFSVAPYYPWGGSWDQSTMWSDKVNVYVGNSTDTPKITDIKITGDPDTQNPTTNCPSTPVDEKVKLEAMVNCPPDFEIKKVSWSGDDVKPGNGDLTQPNYPYEYEAAPGTHGEKTVVCTVKFTNTENGWSGTDSKTQRFKLFFVKKGYDQGGTTPNWFIYWKADGAVPNMDVAVYSPEAMGYGRYDTGTGKVFLTPYSADQHYPVTVTVSVTGESFGGPSVTGIDCTAEIVAHELYHKWVADQWKSGGSFVGKTSSDDDELPDDYENTISHTSPTNPDTYKIWAVKFDPDYMDYGDQELMAMRAGNGVTGTVSNDWANPGKQDPGTQDTSSIPSFAVAANVQGQVQAKFMGPLSAIGNDTDRDGLYNCLTVSAPANVSNGGTYTLVTLLKDNSGNTITFINEPDTLNVGVQSIVVNLDGTEIRAHGVDGPYNVTMMLAGPPGDDQAYSVDNASLITNAYHWTDFQPSEASFSSAYSDMGVDTNGDGRYDYLSVNIGVTVTRSQNYEVEAWLCDTNGNEIVGATNSSYLPVGDQTVALNFDGSSINQHKVNGPYSLMYLSIHSADVADFEYNPYNTSALSYTSFQGSDARFSGTYSNKTEDVDGDGRYDYLIAGIEVSATTAGNYALAGSLTDSNGKEIALATSVAYLNVSEGQTIWLTFPGRSISESGVNGTLQLRHLTLYDENGRLMDSVTFAFNTTVAEPPATSLPTSALSPSPTTSPLPSSSQTQPATGVPLPFVFVGIAVAVIAIVVLLVLKRRKSKTYLPPPPPPPNS